MFGHLPYAAVEFEVRSPCRFLAVSQSSMRDAVFKLLPVSPAHDDDDVQTDEHFCKALSEGTQGAEHRMPHRSAFPFFLFILAIT